MAQAARAYSEGTYPRYNRSSLAATPAPARTRAKGGAPARTRAGARARNGARNGARLAAPARMAASAQAAAPALVPAPARTRTRTRTRTGAQAPARQRPDVRPVRTPASAQPAQLAQAAQAAPASAPIAMLGRLAAVLIVVVAALCFARIALTNAAVTTLIDSDTISSQIEEARTSGVGLEMQQSVLSSPTAINSAVKRLGMISPGEVDTMALEPDVVAYDADGGLSLSSSVKNVVRHRS